MSEYNVKKIKHADGTVQIKKYEYTVKERRPVSQNVHKQESEEKIKMLSEIFGSVKEVPLKIVNETSEERQLRMERNLIASLKRTKSKVYELAHSCIWEYFVTLTFDPQKIDRTDFKLLMAKVRSWLNHNRRIAPDLKYLAIPEAHKKMVDGKQTFHIHILMADIGDIPLKESGKYSTYEHKDGTKERVPIYNMDGWNWGFSTAIPIVRNDERIVNYLLKYVTKEMVQLTDKAGAHRYYASKNLPKAEVQTMNIPERVFDGYLSDYVERKSKK